MKQIGYSHGVDWSGPIAKRAMELRESGKKTILIAQTLTDEFRVNVTYAAVDNFLKRNLKAPVVEEDINIKTFDHLIVPMEDYMISCDAHCPYHSPLWMNRMLRVAEKFKIRKQIIAGDFYDMNFVSFFPSEEKKDVDEEVAGTEEAFKTMDYFDKNYFIQGNHERRIGNFTEGRLRAKHIFNVFGQYKYDSKVVYSLYDQIEIEDKYIVMHPKSYSQISTAVSKKMAEKFHRHVLNAHGHFAGLTYDRSGKFLCVDLGGLFDIKKIEYITMRTTTHPVWNPAFGMIRDGKFTLFHRETDWAFWLGVNHDKKNL